MSKSGQDAPRPPVVGTITQFLTTLPSPLTIALVSLSPQIRFVRWSSELLAWRGDWNESWLLLAGWWGLCLGAEAAIRYTLPLLAIAGWWWLSRRSAANATRSQPATEETLHHTIASLTAIQELLLYLTPRLPSNPANSATSHDQNSQSHSQAASLYTLLRILLFTYPPYLFLTLTSFVRLRTLLGIVGTLVIVHHAPWAVVVRRALWRSAYFRWSVYWSWAKISGLPLPGSPKLSQPELSISMAGQSSGVASAKPASKSDEAASPAAPIRFLFTVYENQRWWVGLDWTAALLPSERPSWCSRSLQACSPPAAFSLPAPSTVYIPPGTSKGTSWKGTEPSGKDGSRKVMKRTAAWSWEEPEWKVVVRKEGATSNTRVERPLPALVEEGATASAGSKLFRAASKIRSTSVDLSPERRGSLLEGGKDGGKDGKEGGSSKEHEKGSGERAADDDQDGEDEEPFTDSDGWVHCDNKWEGGSAKNGMGKFTRYRRWTRVAVLSETVEWVDESDIPAEVKSGSRVSGLPQLSLQDSNRHQSEMSAPPVRSPDTPVSSPLARKSTVALQEPAGSAASSHGRAVSVDSAATTPPADEGSRLRQRLKAVVNGVGH